jgi:hypothetical protein
MDDPYAQRLRRDLERGERGGTKKRVDGPWLAASRAAFTKARGSPATVPLLNLFTLTTHPFAPAPHATGTEIQRNHRSEEDYASPDF